MKYFILFLAIFSIGASAHAQICQAGFSYSEDAGVIYFTNQSTPVDSFTQFQWTFGDGGTSTAMNPSHSYSSGGSWAVCLTMSNGFLNCSSTICDSIWVDSTNVISDCSAAFTFETNGGNVFFYNQSTWDTSAVGFLWTFGDGTSSTDFEPAHYYNSNQTYTTCLTVTTASGCQSEVCHYVSIVDSNCSFTVSTLITGNTVSFVPSNANYTQGNFLWTFGDGTSSEEIAPAHTYSSTGLYSVCVWYSDTFCSSYVCDSVFVGFNDTCYTQFSSYQSGDLMNFSPAWIDFSSTYNWDFGDGTTSSEISPSHQFAAEGSYYVCLTVTNFLCSSTYCEWVYYSNGNNGGWCQANFEVSAIDTVTSTVWLNEISTGANQYFWDFGDGSSSTEQYPTHTYAQNGFYYVCLTVTCDSNVTSQYCAWVGVADSLQGGDEEVRSGFTLIVGQTVSGIAPVAGSKSLSVFPNPANDQLTIQFPAEVKGESVLMISNAFGQLMVRKVVASGNASGLEQIDLKGFLPGMYLIQLTTADTNYTSSVLKQ